MIHVRFQGKSYDLNERVLNLNGSASDLQVKGALAQHFDVRLDQFDLYVVDRRPTGELVVRPEAVYG
ncbi:MAG: hypothetical protein KDD67_04525 [Ignavibacteriae bacterium]|nr:hypothetical protein [Ignavibacteriota bacterium]MCB9214874.1 hypothetical protein [Ignavibacteria bacterium]